MIQTAVWYYWIYDMTRCIEAPLFGIMQFCSFKFIFMFHIILLQSNANWVREMSTASLYFVEAALELFRSPSYRPHHSSGGLQSTKGRPRSKEDQHLTTFQNKGNSNSNKKRNIFEELAWSTWYAEYILVELVSVYDQNKEQTRISEVLQSSSVIKSW